MTKAAVEMCDVMVNHPGMTLITGLNVSHRRRTGSQNGNGTVRVS